MPIEHRCEKCGVRLQIPDSAAGKKVRCKCGHVFEAPVSAGKIQKGDVLVDNFNGVANLQGTGVTIMNYNPSTKKMSLFASLPPRLPQCPGGVGLSTAMTMLKSGWVIVGSAPSTDGTIRTKGDGGLLVLDAI